MNVLVTGSSGLVGQNVAAQCIRLHHNTFSANHKFKPNFGKEVILDLLDTKSIKKAIDKVKPNAVIHCAAISDINSCESKKELVHKVNTLGTQVICESIPNNCFFLYVSTDNVFDGKKGNYKEDDIPNPVNWYGETKLKAEEIVQNYTKDYAIARISTQYGIHERKTNLGLDFIKKIMNKQKIRAATDFYSSPTYVESTAKMLVEIVERRINGIMHICDNERVSRFDFALALIESLDLKRNDVTLEAITIKDLNWKAKRPIDSSLDNSKCQKILHNKPRRLKEGLGLLVKRFHGKFE